MANDEYWIGIGASAGGLDAIKEFLKFLDYKDAIYIIAQHLDPTHPTILNELLEKVTDFPICMIEEDIKPEKGTIYIISPGHNATVKDGKIRLSPAALIGPKPSIDELFSSMAEELKEKSIGIVLSGTGSDGAMGVSSIKLAGGFTFSQENKSAKYFGMPRAAIDTGFVDLILNPEEIAGEIPKLIKSSKQNLKFVESSKDKTSLEKIYQIIFNETSYDFSGYKIKTIQRRIQRRMIVNKLLTLDDYVNLLYKSSSEVEALFKDLLISVTGFFRDKEAFDDLKTIINNMVDMREENGSIRIWVAGCANGAEAYSLAILFEEVNKKQKKQIPFQIFATDIDDYALNIARKAVYLSSQVKDINKDILKKYFTENDNIYMVNKSIRDRVIFAKQNIISDPPFSNIDLISCRNVLIYFNLETQKRIFQTFHYSLKPDCYLFLGKSESASNSVSNLFESDFNKSQIFKRKRTELAFNLEHVKGAKKLVHHQKVFNQNRKIKIKEETSLEVKMNNTIIEKLIPASILINSMGEMLHINGNLNKYLEFPQGRVETNILSMAKGDLKVDIRSLIQQAKRDGNASSQALFYDSEDKNSILFIVIEKMNQKEEDLFVIVFFELNISEDKKVAFSSQTLDDLSKEKLKQEIEVFRNRLQSSIQDLETSNEELQSTNEELQSANEELQSANEELQTANEELQSTNEELSTVNEELEVKSFELGKVNNDLNAMLNSIDENIIFIDNRLRILRYTNKAGKLFELFHDDLGQTITSFSFSMEIPNLRSQLLAVIEKEKELVIALRTKILNHNLRIVPYKFDNKEVVGAILFFEKNQDKTVEVEELQEKLISSLGKYYKYPMVCIDKDHNITASNFEAEKLFDYDSSSLKKMTLNELFLNIEFNQIETILKEKLTDSEGWSSITMLNSSKDKKVIKYKIEKSIDSINLKKIIFFKEA